MLNDLEDQKIEQIRNLEKCNDKKSLQEVLAFLDDRSSVVRVNAISALKEYSSFPAAKDILIGLLKDKDWDVRLNSIETLTYFSGEDVVMAIVELLNDPDWLVQVTCIETLESLAAKSTLNDLLPMLKDKNEIVRGSAAITIGSFGDRTVLPYLFEQLDWEDRSHAKVRIFYGLVLLGEEQYLDSIIQILNRTRSYRIRCAAIHTLTELASKDNVSKIKISFERLLTKEQPRAVSSTLESSLKELNKLEI